MPFHNIETNGPLSDLVASRRLASTCTLLLFTAAFLFTQITEALHRTCREPICVSRPTIAHLAGTVSVKDVENICTRVLGMANGRPPEPLLTEEPVTPRWQLPFLQHYPPVHWERCCAHLPLFLFFSPTLVLSRSAPEAISQSCVFRKSSMPRLVSTSRSSSVSH